MKKIFALLVCAMLATLALISGSASANWTDGINLVENHSELPGTDSKIYVDEVVLTLLLWLLMVFTLIAVLGFVISGIMYILAGSTPALLDKAKNGVLYSIIGIVVGLLGYIVITQVTEILEGDAGTGVIPQPLNRF